MTIRVGSSQDEAPTEVPALRRRASKVDGLRHAYGFDDVSLAPGPQTVEPDDVDTSVEFAGLRLHIPVLAASMDAVVDVRSAGVLAGLGAAFVLRCDCRRDSVVVALESGDHRRVFHHAVALALL